VAVNGLANDNNQVSTTQVSTELLKSPSLSCQHRHFVITASEMHSPLPTYAQLSVASRDKLCGQFGNTLALEARCRQCSLVRFEGAVVARE
jgi:hypothetical protein